MPCLTGTAEKKIADDHYDLDSNICYDHPLENPALIVARLAVELGVLPSALRQECYTDIRNIVSVLQAQAKKAKMKS